jgi:hypothetical protein
MKIKKILIILVLINFCAANAQKGTVLIGGFVSLRSTENTSNGINQKFNSFELTPKVGYQFSTYWTAGIETTIGNSRSQSTSTGINSEIKTNVFNIGGFLAYSKQLTGIFYGFAKITTGLQTEKLSQKGITYTSSQLNGFYIALEPGIYIDLKKGFGLDFFIGGLRYNTFKNQQTDSTSKKELDFTFGKVLKIGISKNL